MKPVEIDEQLRRDVIGQEESLRFVSVAIFKHLLGEPFGNLMLIGSSGTGKTTIMRAVERLYDEHDELQKHRVVVIINANTFASDDGEIDTSRLFVRLEERARRILGDDADAETIGQHMEHATVCIDEIDKVSGMVAGKPYVTGINIQQALLTLIEGEKVDWKIEQTIDGKPRETVVHLDTGRMLFFCGGAYEALYKLVFDRVTSPRWKCMQPFSTTIATAALCWKAIVTNVEHGNTTWLWEKTAQTPFAVFSRPRVFLPGRSKLSATAKNVLKILATQTPPGHVIAAR